MVLQYPTISYVFFSVSLNQNPNKGLYIADDWCVLSLFQSLGLHPYFFLCTFLHTLSGCLKKKLAIISITFPVYMVYPLSPTGCGIFSLSLLFSSLTMMECLDVAFVFILRGICWAPWIFKFPVVVVVVTKFGDHLVIIQVWSFGGWSHSFCSLLGFQLHVH